MYVHKKKVGLVMANHVPCVKCDYIFAYRSPSSLIHYTKLENNIDLWDGVLYYPIFKVLKVKKKSF